MRQDGLPELSSFAPRRNVLSRSERRHLFWRSDLAGSDFHIEEQGMLTQVTWSKLRRRMGRGRRLMPGMRLRQPASPAAEELIASWVVTSSSFRVAFTALGTRSVSPADTRGR